MQEQIATDSTAQLRTVHQRVLRPSSDARDDALIKAAYESWRSVWGATFAELVGMQRLHSDDFARQDELVTLFEGSRCIGLTGFRYLDLDSPVVRDDSYFAKWPEEAIEAVRARGRIACPIGNFMVVPDYRGRHRGVSMSELLTMLSLYRLVCSNADSGLVTARNDRGVNRLMYKYGAVPLVENATLHGVSVDLVCFPKEDTARSLHRLGVMDTIGPILLSPGSHT